MVEQRLQFSKTGRARYISHLDLMRTFQRAFLRADLHVRHTEGFNPHAYVSIALPLSVGFSSECEILELGLPEGTDYSAVPERLNRALPEGITVTRCYDGTRPVKHLSFVDYVVTLEYDDGAPLGVENAIRALLTQESWVVTKPSKKAKSGSVQLDLIPLIQSFTLEGNRNTIVLSLTLKAQNPGLNPTVLVNAIQDQCPQCKPDYVSYHRRGVLDADCNLYE